MKNEYEIGKSMTIIFVKNQDGGYIPVKIDTEDLEKVKKYPGKWFVHKNKRSGMFYIVGRHREKMVMLHRFIMDAPDGMVVDHIYHDTTDNRKSQLRIVTQKENLQNMKGKPGENFRGVRWNPNLEKWLVELKVDRKSYYFGVFKNKDDAICKMKIERARLMPFSREGMYLREFIKNMQSRWWGENE